MVSKGPTWRKHVEQLRLRLSAEDKDPEDKPDIREETKPQQPAQQPTKQLAPTTVTEQPPHRRRQRNPRQPDGDEYSRDNPRRS